MKQLFFLIITLPCFAQAPKDTIKTELLNEVVITANRSENQSFNSGNHSEIISKKYIQTYNSRTTPEALMGVNGVFVQKTNHGGGSPFVRGLTGNQTLLLIDGIRLNNSTFRYGPNQYFNTIDPFSIQKIEVLKGGGSVQYGSDALGGTIQVFTSEPEFESKLHANFMGRLATHGMEQTGRAELSYGAKKFAIQGNLVLRNFGDLVGGKNTGKQTPSGYDEQAANIKAKVKVGNGELTFVHQYFEASNVPVYHKVTLENFAINEFQPQLRNLSYTKYKYESESKFFNEITVIASLQSTKEGRNSQKNASNRIIKEEDRVQTKGFTTTIHSEISENYQINSGIEIYHDRVNSTKIDEPVSGDGAIKLLRGLYPNNSSFLNYSAFTLHQLQVKKLIFSAGLRYNGFSIHVKDETLGATALAPKAVVPNASVLYQIASHSNIYGSFNAGFRTPNIDDLGTLGIVDFRYELPKFDLKPEKSNAFEIGYKLKTAHFSSVVSAYYTSLQNLITRVKVPNQVISGYPVYQKENVEKAFVRGIDYEFEGIFSDKLKAYGGISYTYGQNLTKNEPMRRIPPLNGRIGLDFRKKSFFVRPELMFASAQKRLAQGDKDDNRIGPNGTNGWQVFNFYTGFEKKYFNINLSLQNLTNQDYRTHGSGINGVGRSALLSVIFKI